MVEVDLHLHTTFSDGRLTPTQLIGLCADRGLRVVSITDHDSTEGIPEALEAAHSFPHLTVIPGIELSSDVPGSRGTRAWLLRGLPGYRVPASSSALSRWAPGARGVRWWRS